jgi:bacterioferritin
MKGAAEVIALLNEVLKGEITAISQYFLHASMCKNWGYMGLYKKMYEESIEEMRHAQQLIDRILFLEGIPVMNEPFKVAVGHDVKDMFEKDLQVEAAGLPRLKRGVALCLELEDTGTREMLEHILVDSEEHVEWLETQLRLIEQVGQENYCAQHIQPTS